MLRCLSCEDVCADPSPKEPDGVVPASQNTKKTGFVNVREGVQNRGKKKHMNINKICGIVPGLGGWQKFVCVFFFWVMPYGGEKSHK